MKNIKCHGDIFEAKGNKNMQSIKITSIMIFIRVLDKNTEVIFQTNKTVNGENKRVKNKTGKKYFVLASIRM